jgi:hypothetical protein
MQTRANQGHLLIEGLEQFWLHPSPQSAPQQLRALAEQAAVAAEQLGIHRLELQHHAIQPLTPQRRFAAHQVKIQSAETHAAQWTDQLVLPLQHLPVTPCLAPSLAAQLQLQAITTLTGGGDQRLPLTLEDQIAIAAAAMGAKAPQQLHRLEEVGFALPVAADHQQPRRLKSEIQAAVIAELAQLQAMQPNRSGEL